MAARILCSSGAILALALSSGAGAVSFHDAGDAATFSFGAPSTVDNDNNRMTTGESLSISDGTGLVGSQNTLNIGGIRGANAGANFVLGGEEEFEALNFNVPGLDPVGGSGILPIQLAVGANAGANFLVEYERGQVTDPAGSNGFGAQTGFLLFTITDTIMATVQASGASQLTFDALGTLSVLEVEGPLDLTAAAPSFYATPVAASWTLSGNIGVNSDITSATLTVSVPSDVAAVPLPMPALLLLTGMAGLAYAGRKKARADGSGPPSAP